jgi:hypothetical protein
MWSRAYERASTLLGHYETLALQESDRPTNRRAARSVLLSQLVLGRQALSRLSSRRQDLPPEIFRDALVWKCLAFYLDHNLILQVKEGSSPAQRSARALMSHTDHTVTR